MDQNKNNQEKHIPSADEVKSILGMVEDQYGGTLEKLAKGEEDSENNIEQVKGDIYLWTEKFLSKNIMKC